MCIYVRVCAHGEQINYTDFYFSSILIKFVSLTILILRVLLFFHFHKNGMFKISIDSTIIIVSIHVRIIHIAAMDYITIKLIIIPYYRMYFKFHVKIKSIFKVISWLNSCRSVFLAIQNILSKNNYITNKIHYDFIIFNLHTDCTLPIINFKICNPS